MPPGADRATAAVNTAVLFDTADTCAMDAPYLGLVDVIRADLYREQACPTHPDRDGGYVGYDITGNEVTDLYLCYRFNDPANSAAETTQQVAKTFSQMVGEALAEVPTISPQEASRRMAADPTVLMIDVRDAADIAATGIMPGAVAISYGSLTYRADNEVPQSLRAPQPADRSRPIITTCIQGPLGALGGKLLLVLRPHGTYSASASLSPARWASLLAYGCRIASIRSTRTLSLRSSICT